jgi:hypothetical protein
LFDVILYLGIAVILVFLVLWWISRASDRSRRKSRQKKRVKPTAYDTMPQYFPTEQVDIVNKMKEKKKIKKLRKKK